MNQKIFTVAEVNALIPSLTLLVAHQLREQSEIEHGFAELTRLCGKTPDTLEPGDGDESAEVRGIKEALRQRIERYEAGWKQVQTMGGVVKDAQIGLVDFYGRVEGRLVWLCWRYGEEALEYYHDLDAGFTARRPLTAEVRRQLLN